MHDWSQKLIVKSFKNGCVEREIRHVNSPRVRFQSRIKHANNAIPLFSLTSQLYQNRSIVKLITQHEYETIVLFFESPEMNALFNYSMMQILT